MKELLLRICPEKVHKMYANIKFWTRFHLYPQGIANEFHKNIVGYDIDWKTPKTLNEKINWLKFYSDTSEWTRLADKYLVRDFVKSRIGNKALVKLYGVWHRAEDIDFEKLPAKFILKTNHGAGTVIPVPDKSKADKDEIRKKLNSWLKQKYGYATIEPHYLKIKPLIIAEQLLENDSEFSSSIVDYKVYCFDGKPFCILVCTDRVIGEQSRFSYYDCNWKAMPEVLCDSLKGTHKDIPKPECLNQLLDYASKLSKGFPQVRVDFYIIKGKIYFGEMTFTSEGGYDGDITKSFCLQMGSKITLPTKRL